MIIKMQAVHDQIDSRTSSPFPVTRTALGKGYLEAFLAGFQVRAARQSHAGVLAQTASEHPAIGGNFALELHPAVATREHSVSKTCTRDTDVRGFPLLKVLDSLSGSLDH
ncbi:MAG: hypothetical protein OXJ37_03535 [Bryobacterales bacterium]|nr:hypothetical protein [Bryobacterales bacterium]MDE0261459.1 hypothetical protein [Bryobacterales bacterium]MDE0622948.1 hypothetical protein [Bryobacterales bacterium]